jgi:hypothetical protein
MKMTLVFVTGFLLGGILGILAMALAAAAHDRDEPEDKWREL